MKEETWQPPADAIEREARAILRKWYVAEGSGAAYAEQMWPPGSIANGASAKGAVAVATHVLIERHRRESPLVAALEQVAGFGPPPSQSRVRGLLAAHAALDAPPEPTLAQELVREMPHLAGAHAAMSVAEVVRIVEAVIARERGK